MMKKIFIFFLLFFIVFSLFSEEIIYPHISGVTGKVYLNHFDELQKYCWVAGFLQGVSQIVYLLQLEYKDKTYLDFWTGKYMDVNLFMQRLESFLKSSQDARNAPLPYTGLLILQYYYEHEMEGKR